MTRTLQILTLVLLSTFASSPARAQSSDTSGLTVTVHDNYGVVPGATVTVTRQGSTAAWRAATDAEGRAVFDSLPVGTYDATASFTGFADTRQEAIDVRADARPAIDLTLTLVQFSSQVTVTTANRREQLLLDVAEPTVLIDKGQIEDTAARTAKDLLVELSGAGIQVNAGGGQGYLSLNGIPNKGVLILVNGRRYLGRDANGNFNLEDLPLTGVERVEVVKGAGSAIYGSDALGGVVNFVTGAPKNGVWTGLDINGGSYGDFRANESGGWRTDRGGLTGSIGYRTYDGFDLSEANPQTIGQPASKWKNGDLRGDLRVTDRIFARLSADYSDRDIMNYFFSGATQLATTVYDSQRNLVRHSFAPGLDAQLSSRATLTLDYTHGKYIRDETRIFVVGGRVVPQAPWREWNDEFKASLRYGFNAGTTEHPLQIGFERRQEKLRRATLTVADPERDLTVFWFQQEVIITPRLKVAAGARYDNFSDFGTEWSPKANAVFELAERQHLRLSAGHGFRPPYFGELYLNTPPAFVGNPNLKPETANTVTFGHSWAGTRAQTSADYFYGRVKNGIDFNLSVTPFTYGNLATYTSRGTNLSTSFSLPFGFTPSVSYTYNKRETDDGNELGGYSKHAGVVKLLWNNPRLGLRANLRGQLNGKVPPGSDGRYQPGYQVWYVGGEKRLLQRGANDVSLYVQVSNLFDKTDIFIRTTQGTPVVGEFQVWQAPRTALVGIRVDLDRTR